MADENEAFKRFRTLTEKLVAVPKQEVDKARKKERAKRFRPGQAQPDAQEPSRKK